jgi:hypothetical protein
MKNDTAVKNSYKDTLEKLSEEKIPEGYEVRELPKHIKMPELRPGEII